MKQLLFSALLAAIFILPVTVAQKKGGRADAVQDIKIPDSVSYTVHRYRKGEHSRAGQIGIAVAKEHIGKNRKRPVVVFIHGGGWAKGDKDQLAWQCIRYAQMGYVAATVSYRLIDEAPFPACIQDVMESIRYLKSVCPEFSGDPDNIGLQGYSAGAHLALMIALAGDVEEFHSGAYSEFDSSVQCAFVISTPTDFVERRKRGGPLKMFNESQNADQNFLKRVSPVQYVGEGQIPVLMIHGTADTLVPSYHYEYFQKKCEQEGVSNFQLSTHPEGGHMFFFKERQTYQPIMDRFFAEQLMQ